jgi:hypothetical protein
MATPFDGLFGMLMASGKKRENDYMTGEYASRLGSAPATERGELLSRIARTGGMDMAKSVASIVSAGNQLEIEQMDMDAKDLQVFSAQLKGIGDRRDRMIFIKDKINQRMQEGKDYTKLLELVNMNYDQQNLWATRNMITAENVGEVAKRYLQPQGPNYTKFKDAADGRVLGFNETSQKWEVTDLPAGAQVAPKQPLVNVSLGKERDEMAKVHGQRYAKVLEDGDNAESMIQTLDQLDAIDVSTGALEPAKAAFGALAEGFGFDASGFVDVDNAQALEALSNRLVNDVLNKAKGPQTEGDAIRAKSTIASLKDSPLAKQFKSDSLRAVALRTLEQRDYINERVDTGKTFSQSRAEWNKFKNTVPSLSAIVKDRETGLPMFYYQFKQKAQQANPDATNEEIIQAWQNLNKK